jgi:hypothetical protein
VDGPQPLVQPGRPLRGSPLCSGKRLWPVETPWPDPLSDIVLGVFLASPHREAPENARRKKRGGNEAGATVIVLRFFGIFRSVFRKYFCGVFGLLVQRNGQKRDKKFEGKRRQEKSFFSQLFWPKGFDMGFTKTFYVKLLNSRR